MRSIFTVLAVLVFAPLALAHPRSPSMQGLIGFEIHNATPISVWISVNNGTILILNNNAPAVVAEGVCLQPDDEVFLAVPPHADLLAEARGMACEQPTFAVNARIELSPGVDRVEVLATADGGYVFVAMNGFRTTPARQIVGSLWNLDAVTGNQICETTVANTAPILRALLGGENLCPFPEQALEGAHPTIAADQAALESAFSQLRNDARHQNTLAMAADQTAIVTTFAKLQADSAALAAASRTNTAVQSAMSIVVADLQAMQRDQIQAAADELAGNRTALTAHQRAVLADLAKVLLDLSVLSSAIAAVQF